MADEPWPTDLALFWPTDRWAFFFAQQKDWAMTLEFGGLSRIAEVKAAGDSWEVSGYASTFGNTDQGGDVVLKGAFDAYLASGQKVRFLSAHDQRLVLGTVQELKTDDVGLFGRFSISKTALGQDTHTLLQDGALDSFSIGYITKDAEFTDDGTRLLKEVDLLEVSVVPIPMNERAVVTGVKEKPLVDDDVKFPDFLKQVGDVLESCATKAGALVERRAEAERELSEANLEAIKSLIGTAGAVSDRLEGLIAEPPTEDEVVPPVFDRGLLKLRLEVARKRHERLGILERSA